MSESQRTSAATREGAYETEPASAKTQADAPSLEYAPPQEPTRLRGPRRQRVIFLGIASIIGISLVALMLLYLRWYRSEPASSIIIVRLPSFPTGEVGRTAVSVTGSRPSVEFAPIVLTPENNMTARFHVSPGKYVVRVAVTMNADKTTTTYLSPGELGPVEQMWIHEEHFKKSAPIKNPK